MGKASEVYLLVILLYTKVANILVGGINSVQWTSSNVQTSRLSLAKIIVGRLSTQAGTKLYQIASGDLHIGGPQMPR